MTPHTFRKSFRDVEAAETAVAHHRWLVELRSGIAFPKLLAPTGSTLEFERVPGPTAGPADITTVARALGQLHRAAWRGGLRHAEMNRPFPIAGATELPGFTEPRRQRLHAALTKVECPLTRDDIDTWLDASAELPVTLYKDANPRNAIISPDRGPVLVDVDTLTLAPVGYDLAKLIVTMAMTFGAVAREQVVEALTNYITAFGLESDRCPLGHIQVWAEFHHLLTHPWRGQHYAHEWNAVRTWSADEVVSAARTHVPVRSREPHARDQ
ncbi:phosphotransferase [Actinopolyspora halophila]|uniref:phosphotransferase n=1 Tax=Actinopolyspora halophila TaxID=1850 RepID=UPI0004761B17|nr:phosphotransferase [Actinopolyspora halophila]